MRRFHAGLIAAVCAYSLPETRRHPGAKATLCRGSLGRLFDWDSVRIHGNRVVAEVRGNLTRRGMEMGCYGGGGSGVRTECPFPVLVYFAGGNDVPYGRRVKDGCLKHHQSKTTDNAGIQLTGMDEAAKTCVRQCMTRFHAEHVHCVFSLGYLFME